MHVYTNTYKVIQLYPHIILKNAKHLEYINFIRLFALYLA